MLCICIVLMPIRIRLSIFGVDPDLDGKSKKFFDIFYTSVSLHCFIFLASVTGAVKVFNKIGQEFINKFSSLAIHWVEMDTDPTPDPPK
jgi:hypothetical protein